MVIGQVQLHIHMLWEAGGVVNITIRVTIAHAIALNYKFSTKMQTFPMQKIISYTNLQTSVAGNSCDF